ncbi:MAG TPA: hypothetical protein VNV88_15835 [Candidatus Solibacter sp.]|nr:hypothetical protein [Candidatus Solibacter sp.]
MARIFNGLTAILIVLLCCFASAQQTHPASQTNPQQTARQALIEIVTGGGKAIQKHLTVELQQAITEASKKKKDAGAKAAPDMSMIGIGLMGMPSLAGEKEFQTFESGPLLFSYLWANTKEKVEVRVESDDLSGDQDEILLSIHLFKDGQEQSVPFMPNIIVGLKQQDKIWRLNEIGGNAKLAVGDPKFFEDFLKLQQSSESDTQAQRHSAETNGKEEPPPRLPAASMVTMLAYAEASYAGANPDVGFTCNLADLANGKDAAFSEMIDPLVGTGTYNGYRFGITGCDAKPSTTFRIIAEPLVAGAGSKAYCTDPTHNLRVSDDGRGATCLASGRVMNSGAGSGMTGFKVGTGTD